ncbi:hypothetical protein E4U43_001826 [Claviceps pusilla]|uniref:Peptidase A1 domain-containing protein n=1 Tax=Claviceps pusilla TaxID=123648 RepID=A0A9P7N9J2_9HYPO|nr:hypothetical protein E4U43_001826 [Claviceps pusilla]
MLPKIAWIVGGLLVLIPMAAPAVLDLPIGENGYNVVSLQIGTPGKNFQFLFDTGSSTSWVVDGACASSACPNFSGYNRTGYLVEDSSTGKSRGRKASIDYLGGSTTGDVVDDVFSDGKTSWVQSFISATRSSWSDLPADGFLGLSFDTISVGGTSTVMHTLMSKLDKPRFGLYYNNSLTQGPGTGGLLTLGDSRESRFVHQPMAKIPVVQRGGQYDVWRTRFRGITVRTSGGNVKHVENGKRSASKHVSFDSGNAIFDTGACNIDLDKTKISDVYKALGWDWAQLWRNERILKCTEFNSSWSVTFEFGPDKATASEVTLTGDQLARPGLVNRADACWPPFVEGSSYKGFSLFGTLFLKQVYTVWDFGSHEVSGYNPTLSFGNTKQKVE